MIISIMSDEPPEDFQPIAADCLGMTVWKRSLSREDQWGEIACDDMSTNSSKRILKNKMQVAELGTS